MWRRFKRMVRANLGRLSELGGGGGGLTGDLERQLQDLDRQLPQFEETLAGLKGEVTFLEEKVRKLARREGELEALAKAALQRGSDQASKYALDLEVARTERALHEKQLAVARAAVERGQEARKAVLAERDRKRVEVQERQRALLELEREDALGPLAADEPALAAPPLAEAPPSAAPDPFLAGARPAASTKTVGGTPVAGVPLGPRAAKTIGPVADAPPATTPVDAAAAPPPPAAPAAGPALKIRVRSRDAAGDSGPVRLEVRREEAPSPPRQAEADPAGTAETGALVAKGAAGAATATAPATDLVSELERLVRLHEQGVLTQEELDLAKRRLLEGGAA
jgi:hypothetical protein